MLYDQKLVIRKAKKPGQDQHKIPGGLVCPDLGCKGTLDERGRCAECGLLVETCREWLSLLELDVLASQMPFSTIEGLMASDLPVLILTDEN